VLVIVPDLMTANDHQDGDMADVDMAQTSLPGVVPSYRHPPMKISASGNEMI